MAGHQDGGRRHNRESHYREAALLHPLRQRILRLTCDSPGLGLTEIAAELDEPPRRVAHHLRILVKRGALKLLPQRPPTPPLYRWASDAEWARKMLDEIEQRASGNG